MNVGLTRPARQRAMCLVHFCLLAVLTNSVGRADIISFDPDGTAAANGASSVGTFDLLPGNAVFRNLGSIITPKSNQPVTHFIQVRLGALLGPNGNTVSVTGLNSSFEITIAAGYDALASTSAVPNTSNFGTSYDLVPNAETNFFKIFYDNNAPTAVNDLAGTGFDEGLLILSGNITKASGSFSQFGSVNPPLPHLDSFGGNDYPGQTSYRVAGGESLTIFVNSYDANFFTGINGTLKLELFNQSEIAPFRQVNPSAKFLPNLANFTPNLGPINGAGSDFQTQADANSSFTVEGNIPEPSSVVLLAGGLAALLAMTARRARQRRRSLAEATQAPGVT